MSSIRNVFHSYFFSFFLGCALRAPARQSRRGIAGSEYVVSFPGSLRAKHGCTFLFLFLDLVVRLRSIRPIAAFTDLLVYRCPFERAWAGTGEWAGVTHPVAAAISAAVAWFLLEINLPDYSTDLGVNLMVSLTIGVLERKGLFSRG